MAMLISDVMVAARARFRTLDAYRSVRDAADIFSDPQVGLLVVSGRKGETAGVVSKFDIVRHLARSGRVDTPLAEVMSHSVVSTSPTADLRQTRQFMVQRGLQNLPLIDADRKPVGMLDIRKTCPSF
jgi:CBS domain-containing protein